MVREPFAGTIPDDRLYCRQYDMWVQEVDGGLLVGATAFGVHQAGEVIAFTAKPAGANVERGRGLGTIECHKTVLAVRTPISFVLLEGNEAAEERPALLNRDPHGKGWMVRVRPLDWAGERTALVDAPTYRAHVRAVDPQASFDEPA
ncbi:MAG: glycine cleavage system protein H [Rhodocyclales bacterium]|nr:glycine cleavage system protein H [Rhodocyclales bacterium]